MSIITARFEFMSSPATARIEARLIRFNSMSSSQGTLYIVSTPIGNLRDITLRALDVLAAADLVLAEDTRLAGKLLAAYGLSAKLERYGSELLDVLAGRVSAPA